MRPIMTPTTNAIGDVRPGDAGDLPLERHQHGFSTMWELDDEERNLIAAGGRVEIHMGVLISRDSGVPPMAVRVSLPESTDGDGPGNSQGHLVDA